MPGAMQFYEYFYEQNEAIGNGSSQGVKLEMNSLGVSSLPQPLIDILSMTDPRAR